MGDQSVALARTQKVPHAVSLVLSLAPMLWGAPTQSDQANWDGQEVWEAERHAADREHPDRGTDLVAAASPASIANVFPPVLQDKVRRRGDVRNAVHATPTLGPLRLLGRGVCALPP